MLINLLPLPATSTLAKVVHSYRFVMLLTKCMLTAYNTMRPQGGYFVLYTA